MPQMSPMWWTLLFYMFIMIFILFMILMYFNIQPQKIKKSMSKSKISETNWKW